MLFGGRHSNAIFEMPRQQVLTGRQTLTQVGKTCFLLLLERGAISES